jgi:cellulose/xylan binding protein with CBM9 domain
VISDVLFVPRAEFQIEDPWAVPPMCQPVRLRRATDGKPPRLSTTVAAYSDGAYLTLVFRAADDAVAVATYRNHDAPLYKEDVVELFLAPALLTEYFEFEVSPMGTTFDALIRSPNGTRDAMKVDVDWNCRGLFAAVKRASELSGDIVVDTVVRIPYESIGATPRAGDQWRANLFRIDRRNGNDEYSAWHPTWKDPPDFHVVAAFGRIVFENG